MTNSKRRSLITGVLFVLAIGLLLFSTVSGARAALTYSDDYTTDLRQLNVGLVIAEKYSQKDKPLLLENGQALLSKLVGPNEPVSLGKEYFEQASVINNGTVDEVIRVQIYKYWTDASGKKLTDVDLDLIGLNIVTDGWIEDESESTDERTILYCSSVVPAGGATPIFTDGLTIGSDVAKWVIETPDGNGTVTTSFVYEGMQFNVEVEADAVQARHGAEAAKSAWGVTLSVDEDAGTVSLG